MESAMGDKATTGGSSGVVTKWTARTGASERICCSSCKNESSKRWWWLNIFLVMVLDFGLSTLFQNVTGKPKIIICFFHDLFEKCVYIFSFFNIRILFHKINFNVKIFVYYLYIKKHNYY